MLSRRTLRIRLVCMLCVLCEKLRGANGGPRHARTQLYVEMHTRTHTSRVELEDSACHKENGATLYD